MDLGSKRSFHKIRSLPMEVGNFQHITMGKCIFVGVYGDSKTKHDANLNAVPEEHKFNIFYFMKCLVLLTHMI